MTRLFFTWLLFVAYFSISSAQAPSLPNNPEVLKTAAQKYINSANYERAIDYGHRMVELGKQNSDATATELDGHIIVGHAAVMQGQPILGFLNLQEALSVASRINNKPALAKIYNSLGLYYLKCLNDPYSAITNFYQAIDYARATNDNSAYADILSNIAGAYLLRNDNEGFQLAKESFDIAQQHDDNAMLFKSADILARYYILKDSINLAKEKIAICRRLAPGSGNNGKAQLAILNSELWEHEGNVKQALSQCDQAIALVDSGLTHPLANQIRLTNARLLRLDGKPQQAIQVLFDAISKAAKSRTESFVPQMFKEASLAFRDANTPETALRFAHFYEQYQDSVFSLSRERALQEARIKNDIVSRDREIDRQKIELLSTRNNMILLVGGIILLLILLASTFYSKHRKEKLYTAIVNQNREYLKREAMLLDRLEKARNADDETTTADQSAQSSSISTDKIKDLMERFTALMLEQKLFTDPGLSVSSVAEYLSTNRTYLSKAINESTGNTFTQVVNDYRIREAIRLISDTEANIPLKQIAFDVGFNSMSTFYVTFQSITGMTPARYRSKTRANA